MRNDIYVGALIALGTHAALALIAPAVRPQPAIEPVPTIAVNPWPTTPAEPGPEPPLGDVAELKETTVTAPRLADVPRVAPSDGFTMPPTVVPDGGWIDPKTLPIPTERVGPRKGAGEIIDLAALDRAPVARFQAQPQYPFEMKRGGISGEVLVEFIVEANGTVREARAVGSSPREFEAAAVQAVSKWTFRPGQKGGRNVAARMQVPIVFTLNEARE
ncbi:MAG: energy transducer TonB [Undibacterium sp.]|nr:energy transducer TonB [Opitutaceae bacterium]